MVAVATGAVLTATRRQVSARRIGGGGPSRVEVRGALQFRSSSIGGYGGPAPVHREELGANRCCPTCRRVQRDVHGDRWKWAQTAEHPRFKRLCTGLLYRPILEMMEHLRANGFRTYIHTSSLTGTDPRAETRRCLLDGRCDHGFRSLQGECHCDPALSRTVVCADPVEALSAARRRVCTRRYIHEVSTGVRIAVTMIEAAT
jgi:hypothetical protein